MKYEKAVYANGKVVTVANCPRTTGLVRWEDCKACVHHGKSQCEYYENMPKKAIT